MDWYIATARLALTEDDRIVPEEHPEARWLYAIPGTQIPMAEALRYGLVEDEAEPEPLPAPDVFTPVVESEPVKRPRGRPRKGI